MMNFHYIDEKEIISYSDWWLFESIYALHMLTVGNGEVPMRPVLGGSLKCAIMKSRIVLFFSRILVRTIGNWW